MKKIVILFLSIIVLTPITSLAVDQNTLPPLPPAFEQESNTKSAEHHTEDADQESFWQKIKSFFGFGEEKEKTGQAPQSTKDTSQDLKEPEQPKVLEKEKEVVAKVEEAVEVPKIETQPVQPMDSTDNGQQAVIDKVNQEQGNLSVTTPIGPEASLVNQGNTGIQLPVNTDQQNESDQLQLPAGFGDENQDVSKTTNATSIPQVPETAPSLIAIEPVTTNIPNAEPVQPSQLQLPTAPEENNKENTEPKEDEKNVASPDSNTNSVSEDVASIKSDVNDIKPPSVSATPSLPKENEAMPAVPAETKVELPKPETQSVEKVDDTSSPTPAYAGEEVEKDVKSDDTPTKSDSLVGKYTKQVQNSKSIQELPKITSDEIEKSDSSSNEKVDDGKQLKFIEDEAKVLSIPNDDVVLGELTNEAKLEQVDFREYVIKFWEFYNVIAREPKRKEIDNFIQKFDDNAEYIR